MNRTKQANKQRSGVKEKAQETHIYVETCIHIQKYPMNTKSETVVYMQRTASRLGIRACVHFPLSAKTSG